MDQASLVGVWLASVFAVGGWNRGHGLGELIHQITQLFDLLESDSAEENEDVA
jgi:hypothetical protein